MRFTVSVTSSADYDSEGYFTAERTFNTDYLPDAVEHLDAFLKSAGFIFDRLEAVDDLDCDLTLDEEINDAEDYNRNYINRK